MGNYSPPENYEERKQQVLTDSCQKAWSTLCLVLTWQANQPLLQRPKVKGEGEEGVLKATGRTTGSSQCRYMALCLRSLSRPYNELMLAGAQRNTDNNRHRKAHKLALLVSWVCIQRAGTQTKQNTQGWTGQPVQRSSGVVQTHP